MKGTGMGEHRDPDDVTLPWLAMLDHGVLWAINRAVFHPRGFALAIDTGTVDGKPIGWSLHGDGSEPWKFVDDAMEDDRFAAFEALLAAARAR